MKKPLLFLKKDNMVVIINDWLYNDLVPTTYYHHYGRLSIDVYDLEYVDKDGNGHYKYVEMRQKT